MAPKKSIISDSEAGLRSQDLLALFESNPTAQLVLDEQGIIIELNTSALELFQSTKKNLIGREFVSLIPKSKEFLCLRFLQEVRHSNNKQNVQLTFLLTNGDFIHTQILGFVQRKKKRNPHIYLFVQDISGKFYRDNSKVDAETIYNAKTLLDDVVQQVILSQDLVITAAILHAQEIERKRISEALHDSVSQLLYGIRFNLDEIRSDPMAVGNINKLLGLAIEETRNISFELAPSVLLDFGLKVTIEEMCHRLSTNTLSIVASFEGMQFRMDHSTEINIFRIVQELVNNSIKHATPTYIRINMNRRNNVLLIRVTDNGCGFDQGLISTSPSGSGLATIRNRLILIPGTLKISSEINKGTIALVRLKI